MNDFDGAPFGGIIHAIMQFFRYLTLGDIIIYPVFLGNLAERIIFILFKDLGAFGVTCPTTNTFFTIYFYFHQHTLLFSDIGFALSM